MAKPDPKPKRKRDPSAWVKITPMRLEPDVIADIDLIAGHVAESNGATKPSRTEIVRRAVRQWAKKIRQKKSSGP